MKILKTNGELLIDLPQFDNIKDAVMHCVLNEINLSYADLSDANLSDANLSYANLRGADLSCANLSDADLRGANLRGANLRGADLWGADTQYCYRFGHFSKLGGRCCFYYKPIETEPIYIIVAGCFSGTLDEFEEACKYTHPNDPAQAYEAQIAYLRTILK